MSLAGQFEVDLVDDRLTVWEARLFEWNFDEDSRLHGDLAALADRAPDDDAAALVSVVLRVHFPDDFPFAPPLVYVASPPLASEYIFDGALCMEMLVDWQPQYGNVDSMLVQIAAFLACSARVAEIAGTSGGETARRARISVGVARGRSVRLQRVPRAEGVGTRSTRGAHLFLPSFLPSPPRIPGNSCVILRPGWVGSTLDVKAAEPLAIHHSEHHPAERRPKLPQNAQKRLLRRFRKIWAGSPIHLSTSARVSIRERFTWFLIATGSKPRWAAPIRGAIVRDGSAVEAEMATCTCGVAHKRSPSVMVQQRRPANGKMT